MSKLLVPTEPSKNPHWKAVSYSPKESLATFSNAAVFTTQIILNNLHVFRILNTSDLTYNSKRIEITADVTSGTETINEPIDSYYNCVHLGDWYLRGLATQSTSGMAILTLTASAIMMVRTRDDDGIGVVPIEASVARTIMTMYWTAVIEIP